MSPHHTFRIRREVDLIQRFARSYRQKFAELIERMNHTAESPAGATPEQQCLRLCVEAVDMILETQDQLADAVAKLTSDDSGAPSGPRLRPAA
jgi:hypothetical protein